MNKTAALLAAAATLGLASAASAQTPLPLTNPSFEEINPFSTAEPKGWHNLSDPFHSRRRTLSDGLTPQAYVRSGEAAIEIRTPGFSEFKGFTSDTLNWWLPNFPFFDPVYEWDGGDVKLTGWYYIPVDDPITGDLCAIKMNIKRGNQDYATLDPWAGEGPVLSGDTNGEWRYYEVIWAQTDIHAEVEFGVTQGWFVIPPYPDHCKITFGRWAPGTPPSGGRIYWDDITFEQINPCPADMDGDGFVTGDDFTLFVTWFEGGDLRADFDGDGFITGDDFTAFVIAFETGC